MTDDGADESDATAGARSARPSDGSDAGDRPDSPGDPESVEDALAELTERVADLERTVAWIARQQAAETGNSACPACNTGGSLRVSRTPTGKKQVECRNCGEKLN
ncbi:hypothetical protein [Halorussus sp. AFM4]|uniref:hypothetical protein n=1 Tax=Halorussus sp. AFM4 TaxID=3421651 RepID=UPI003EB92F18